MFQIILQIKAFTLGKKICLTEVIFLANLKICIYRYAETDLLHTFFIRIFFDPDLTKKVLNLPDLDPHDCFFTRLIISSKNDLTRF